ncbi:MAG: hypothetical protein ACI9T8_000381, partial [Candidatus Saccharimonadales bacterium]
DSSCHYIDDFLSPAFTGDSRYLAFEYELH